MASSVVNQEKWSPWLVAGAISLCLASQLMAQDEPTAEIQPGDTQGANIDKIQKANVEHPWIGVAAGHVDDALRAHMEIPGNSGLIIHQVAPNSPAEKAGLQEHDVLIRADKNPLGTPQDLVEIVKTWDGQTDGIKIEWLRRGEEMNEIITPTERPADFGMPANTGFGDIDADAIELKMKQLGLNPGGKGKLNFRFIGPGMQAGTQTVQSINENGLKIRIERENDDPAQISVDDGESSWEVTEDDLDQLPEELAQRVQQLLKNQGNAQIQIDGPGQVPNAPFPEFKQIQEDMRQMGFPQMQQRIDEMERQMQKMLEEFERIQPQELPADEDAVDPNHDA